MSERQLKNILIASAAGTGGAALVLLGLVCGLPDVVVALVVAAGLVVPARVPWGGTVPMGAAGVIAVVALLDRGEAAATLGVALLLGAVLLVCRVPRPHSTTMVARFAASMAGAYGAALLVGSIVDGTLPTLAAAAAGSGGLVVGDLAVARFGPTRDPRIELRSALPVHLTLACAGTLIAVAVDQVGVAMAAVAAFPLLITRFSFDRHAGATDTLEQTVQALGLVPELAGLVPLGHSERSASYAVALSRALGFDRMATTRIVTATRLHHLGAVPVEGGDDAEEIAPGEVAAQGARILREAGFPNDVAELLETARADTLDAEAPTLEAAVVRVAATFDEIVGDDPHGADRGLALVSGAARDPHSRRAAGALLELVATRPHFVGDAVAAGDRFREAATGLDLESVTTRRGGPGEILPFTRPRVGRYADRT
jgi:hypothetical protein